MRGRRMGRPGLVGTMARAAVITGTATAVSGSMQQRSAQQQAMVQQPVPASAPGAPDARLAQLVQLGELKAQGILTEEEFTAEKRRILSS